MRKFAYAHVVKYSDDRFPPINEQLSKLSSEGWQIVGVVQAMYPHIAGAMPGTINFFLQKEITDETP